MEKAELIKCPRCGFKNIKGTKKCTKCRTNIDTLRKSCPKCGKINPSDIKRCVTCKFDFTKKARSIWGNLIISGLLVVVLCALVFFGKESVVEKFDFGLRVLAGFLVFVLIIKTFTYGEKHKINYSAEEELVDGNKGLNAMKAWSNLIVIIGFIFVLGFLIYYYVFR